MARILHLDTGKTMQGGQWQVLRLVEGLRAVGVESHLLAPAGTPLLERVPGARAFSLLGLRGEASRCDLIHAHDARAHWMALFLGRPIVVSRRVAFPIQRHWWSRWKYRWARHFIAVSNAARQELLRAGVPRESVTVVHDGVPLLEAPLERSAVVAVDSAKGRALLEQVDTRIVFSRDLITDLRRARAFVYSTESEGLGSAALLAMSARVPVIASDVAGLREIVVHEQTGLLCRNTIESFSKAIRRIADEPELAQRLANAGRVQVEERFTSQRMVAGTRAVYDRVMHC